jgi:hypothetical protein
MRNRLFASGVLILAVAATFAATAVMAKGKSGADGVWKVKITPDANASAKGEKESDDSLILKGGKFHSTGCDPYGFGPAPFRTEGNHFMADVQSQKEGRIHWHGEVTGDSVSGQMTWTKTDGSVLNYTFTGTRSGDAPQTKTSKDKDADKH